MLPRRVERNIAFFTIGFALILLVVVIPYGIVTPRNVRLPVLSPLFWPVILGGALLLCGVLLAIRAHFSSEDEQVEREQVTFGRPEALRLAALLILIVAYYLAIPFLGMVWASVAAFLAMTLITGTKWRVHRFIWALVLPLALYAFFSHVAGVPIPQGQLVRLP
ncbi:MAG TPA: tripartite tricarboxylate transporter TctB family protein [Aurantimonas sp.]|uniref:Tripartite tricarboxylate transporter TctB family protein n=1 Tax=Aurantimonas marianensis TaxID=2920428 RepID=A0A9X2HAX1_9HYPH|nr:tripartite tricarboxylate transporter TctB family protein [Aurantimonas marianensis]MCP3057013.1 tripartite tricarboxylate transporter TctB family protein [Aurantimonas marianensis]